MNRFFNLTAILFLFFLAFVIVKASGKPFSWIEDVGYLELDNELIYFNKKNYKDDLKNIKTDKFGFRGGSHELEFKDKHVLVGSSIVFGVELHENQTLTYHLNQLLDRQGIKNEFVNAGVTGFCSDQIYRMITDKIMPLKPKTILWITNLSLLTVCRRFPLYEIEESGHLKKLGADSSWYFKTRLLFDKVLDIKENALARLLFDSLNYIGSLLSSQSDNLGIKIKKNELIFEDLRRLAIKEGINIKLVIVPNPLTDEMIKNRKLHTQMDIVDLRDQTVSLPQEKIFFKNDYHFSPMGSEIFAKIIYDSIYNGKR